LKTRLQISGSLSGLLLAMSLLWSARGQTPTFPVTNLLDLIQLLETNETVVRGIRLEATVCAASDSSIGVIILRDETAAASIEFGRGEPAVVPGDRIRIDQSNCFLRRRNMGIQVTTSPVVNNDGIHARRTTWGDITLKKGQHSFAVEWFCRVHEPGLEVKWRIPGSQIEDIPAANFFCLMPPAGSREKTVHGGLIAECYEGDWERLPDFDLLNPVKTAHVTNCDLSIGTNDKLVGVRFAGQIDVPVDGLYRFTTRSADGSLLFVGDSVVPIRIIGKGAIPAPVPATLGEPVSIATRQEWITVEGWVAGVSRTGRGAELKLALQQISLLVRIADCEGFDVSDLLHSQVRVTGVGVGHFALDGKAFLGEVIAANKQAVETVRMSKPNTNSISPLLKAEQVQAMTLDEARRHQPVRLHGVVTSKGNRYDNWYSIQDDTRGIFVNHRNTSNSIPSCGDFCEVVGHSDVGDFAPIIMANQTVRLGKAQFPDPLLPTWEELNNGSMDVQWVEFKGLVTDIQTNMLSMLLPGGQMQVQIEGPPLSSLTPLRKAVVRVRGTLFAVWNSTREVCVGSVSMRNAQITVEIPPPSNPFDAELKTPRGLLLFDAQATPFRRVKVKGLVTYADSKQAFLEEDGKGLRLLAAEREALKPGDLIEAAGYPNISRNAIVLRQAVIQKTGVADLPAAKQLADPLAEEDALDSTRVRIEGSLLGWHAEQGDWVLEMQSGKNLFLARLSQSAQPSLRVGSRLRLEGIYVLHATGRQEEARSNSFELLMNSTGDIRVLSTPSWWTLRRMLILVGCLVTILILSTIWITQLRRLVEQRTAELQRETRHRAWVEQQRALEIERSRIARDLHDDLGSGLTEITMLATGGPHGDPLERNATPLFHSISSKACTLVAALDVIVWAINPKDNSLQSAADYLSDFADEFLSSSGIACRFQVPVTLPPIVLEGRYRHDLVLAVKETLNNIVRHAQATEVLFNLTFSDGALEIRISDNGKGFDPSLSTNGNGLNNLPTRLAGIGGYYEFESAAGRGTTTKIGLKLPTQNEPPFRVP
jgi:signal transduction histidine kinase